MIGWMDGFIYFILYIRSTLSSGNLSKLFISLSGDPNCSHFSELRYQKGKEKKNRGTQMKNDKAVGKQSQYPLLHEADTQSNSA